MLPDFLKHLPVLKWQRYMRPVEIAEIVMEHEREIPVCDILEASFAEVVLNDAVQRYDRRSLFYVAGIHSPSGDLMVGEGTFQPSGLIDDVWLLDMKDIKSYSTIKRF